MVKGGDELEAVARKPIDQPALWTTARFHEMKLLRKVLSLEFKALTRS